jgi:hypothetical protein
MANEVVKGTSIVLYNLKVTQDVFTKGAADALNKGGGYYMKRLEHNTTKTDHSQKDLTRLDHPYARRHGSIRRIAGHSYQWQIHSQSGAMNKAMFSDKADPHAQMLPGGVQRVNLAFIGGFKPEMAEEVNWVLYGTDKMLGRPAPGMALDRFWKTIKTIIIRHMGKQHLMAWGRFRKN